MSVNLKKTKIMIFQKSPGRQDHKHSFKLDNMPLERSQNYLSRDNNSRKLLQKEALKLASQSECGWKIKYSNRIKQILIKSIIKNIFYLFKLHISPLNSLPTKQKWHTKQQILPKHVPLEPRDRHSGKTDFPKKDRLVIYCTYTAVIMQKHFLTPCSNNKDNS